MRRSFTSRWSDQCDIPVSIMSISAINPSRTIEWPTWALIVALFGAWGILTWHAAALPWWLLILPGAYLVCLHGSLQHEALHGHPTRSPLLNEALLFPALSLWFPYRRYRKLHLIHHRNDHLTDPLEDPESYYFEPPRWEGMPRSLQMLFGAMNSMLGRLLLGPAVFAARFFVAEMKLIAGGNREIAQAWLLHGAGIAMVFLWVSVVCGLPFWQYVLFIAYPGMSLTMLRSFAEHRAHENAACRTIVVESSPLLSLVFLNNNLHMAHHERPGLAWYRLPAYDREHKQRLLGENCGYLVKGYGELARKYLLTPKEPVAHPGMATLKRIRDGVAAH